MYCTGCGRIISDDAKFCKYCGAVVDDDTGQQQTGYEKTEILISPDNAAPPVQGSTDVRTNTGGATGDPGHISNNSKEINQPPVQEQKKRWPIVLLLVLIILLSLGILLAIFVYPKQIHDYMDSNTKEQSGTDDESDTINKTEDPEGDSATKDGNGDAAESSTATQEQKTPVVQDDNDYLVCVPVDYMSLRRSPGLGNDVIMELRAGTLLIWEGVTQSVGDSDYYYVTVKDNGRQGYVAADYCVDIDFMYDDSDLTMVQTSNALYSYEDMVDNISELTAKYPEILSSEVIGTSVDGRNIYEVTLGNPNASQHVMMQASIHGREYMNTQLVMKLIEYYCFYYNTGSYQGVSYSSLFDKTAFHIIPMANPDGVTISQFGTAKLKNQALAERIYECYNDDKGNMTYDQNTNGDYTWNDHYKDTEFDLYFVKGQTEITYDQYQKIWKSNANGVDLNNNFDAGWADIDLKGWKSYGSFKGKQAESEPETKALVDCALKRDYECYVSYHSMGQLIYYDVQGNTAQNTAASTKLADAFSEQIKYQTVNTNKGYNVNLGGFGDWVQLKLGKPSITIESGKKPCPLDSSEFPGIWHRHRESWAMLALQLY